MQFISAIDLQMEFHSAFSPQYGVGTLVQNLMVYDRKKPNKLAVDAK
jgi:hypothetical protein